MHVLGLACGAADREWLLAELYELGTLGIIEHDLPGGNARLEAFFETPFDASPFTPFDPAWVVRDPDIHSWRDAWEPLPVGDRFFLVPDWRDDPAPEGRLRLTVHARQASGSGYHAPTQLMLRAMESTVTGGAFLDVGTGSGILSSAARLLGAGPVWACDIDPDALAEARANAASAAFFLGSVRAVRTAAASTIAANLNAEALVCLAADLQRALAPDGHLIVSGFKARRLDRVRHAFPLHVHSILEDGDWRCMVLRHRRSI
ncbi:MAG: 50S ribosomal protein L11 methyltransferase [Bryobacteraceae bacterium]